MASSVISKVVAVVGAGNMATALIKGLVNGIISPCNLRAASPSGAAAVSSLGIFTTSSNSECVNGADVVVLAVKPIIMASAIADIVDAMKPGALVVSVAAGTTIQTTTQSFGRSVEDKGLRFIRVMPNTPCAISCGVTGIALGPTATEEDAELVKAMFSAIGIVEVIPERLMDAFTGLAGSGPAYVLMMIEALADGGVAAGLPRATAQRVAAQLVKGTAQLVQESGKHTAELKDCVASPGGTTIAGILALEDGKFRSSVMNAVLAAARRGEELGKS